MPPPVLRPRRLAVLVLGGAAGACGPSFQAIYEGNARFEHCYALEEKPQSPMSQKADCWRDWSERYTYGQTRDRVQYAIARYVALSQVPNAPTDEAMMMAAPGVTPRVSTITAPAPTNAFAPPPKVLELDGGAPAAPVKPSEIPQVVATTNGTSALGLPPLPQSSCSDRCQGGYRMCQDTCAADAGARADHANAGSEERCRACDRRYAVCMRACFK